MEGATGGVKTDEEAFPAWLKAILHGSPDAPDALPAAERRHQFSEKALEFVASQPHMWCKHQVSPCFALDAWDSA